MTPLRLLMEDRVWAVAKGLSCAEAAAVVDAVLNTLCDWIDAEMVEADCARETGAAAAVYAAVIEEARGRR